MSTTVLHSRAAPSLEHLPLDNTKIKGEVLLDTFNAAFKSNAGASPYLLPNVLRTNIVVPLTNRSGRIALTSNNF